MQFINSVLFKTAVVTGILGTQKS